ADSSETAKRECENFRLQELMRHLQTLLADGFHIPRRFCAATKLDIKLTNKLKSARRRPRPR
ncbi:MAG: hypothetical protein WBW08_14355, partial [Methyloceanibacter sp.]